MAPAGRRVVIRAALPWLVAFAVPGVVLGVMYALAGAQPSGAVLGGLVGGLVGLFGASLAALVRVLLERRATEARADEMQAWLRDRREQDGPPDRG